MNKVRITLPLSSFLTLTLIITDINKGSNVCTITHIVFISQYSHHNELEKKSDMTFISIYHSAYS